MAAGLQIVLFEVGGVEAALRRSEVRELLPIPHLWRPPVLPRPVAGFLNLGGQAVPVLLLAHLFGLEEREVAQGGIYRHLVLVDRLAAGSGPAALLVDRVLDLASVAPDHLSPVDGHATLNGCVEAEIDHEGRLVHLLALERILLLEERQSLAELGRQAQSRLSEWAVTA